MVHLIYKLYLKTVFLRYRFFEKHLFLTLSMFLTPKNKREIPKLVPDDPKTGAWLSQNWCLTVPKMVPDNHQAPFWGLFLRSQIWSLTTGCIEEDSSSVLFCTASCQASYLGSQKISQKWCLTIVRHQFWDRQASILGSSGTSFGIVRHQFWDLTLILWSLKRALRKKRMFFRKKTNSTIELYTQKCSF